MSFSEEKSPLKSSTNKKTYDLSKMSSENKQSLTKKGKESGKKNRRKLTSKNNKRFKSKSNQYGTTLRMVDALLREVNIIEEECASKTAKNKKEKILDPFQQAKKDLNDKLKEIKMNSKTQKNIQARVGTGSEAIKLKQQIKEDLEEAKALHAKLEQAYRQNKADRDNERDDALNYEQLKEREELVELLKQDLEYTEHGSKPKNEQGRGYSLAREQRNRRKKMKEEGKMNMEPVPLTQKQQAFIQMSIERDAVIDEKLDIILQGVKQVNAIGTDVNNELKKQEIILDEIDEKMDNVTMKLEKRNAQMKDILERSGGLQRWCPIVILLVILLAIVGWIWSSLTA